MSRVLIYTVVYTKLSIWHNPLATTMDRDNPAYSFTHSMALNRPATSGTKNSTEFLPKSTSHISKLITVAIFDEKEMILQPY
jgi:hypothetical protein